METLTAPVEAPVVAEATLNTEQQAAFDIFCAGGNLLITGPAGTGKSFLLQKIQEKFPDLTLTGTTGISALNISGCTIHSWARLGIGDKPAEEIVKHLNEKKDGTWYVIRRATRLAIDEISMLDAKMFDLLDEVLRGVRKTSAPFGGVQLVCFGDFLQLPPVAKDGQPAYFAFESKAWQSGNFKVVLLKQVVRQKEAEFANVLSRVRLGERSIEVRDFLRPRINAVDPDPSISPVELTTHNTIADDINHRKLEEIKEPEIVWESTDWADTPFLLKQIDRDCIAQKTLVLKVGAQVMLLKNISPEEGLMNGSLGVLVGTALDRFSRTVPVVKFQNGITRELEKAAWELKRNREVLASREQIPLRPAWAITIHKSQGITLDKARVHLANCFADGQSYVALSRVRTLEGLFIADISVKSIKANATALDFYRRHST